MNYFERIRVDGYRRLHALDLPLRPLNVLIGANGSGKTSFLEVFSLLAASASGKLKDAIGNAGGITALLTLDRAKVISFVLSMSVTEKLAFQYELGIKSTGISYQIETETLERLGPERVQFFRRQKTFGESLLSPDYINYQGDYSFQPLETALSLLKTYGGLDSFQHQLSFISSYHAIDVGNRSSIRLPQPLRPADSPGNDGEDLVSCLFSLRENDRDGYETIEDTLRVAFPGFERLDFPPVAAGTVAMVWKDKNFSRPLYMNQLSEGMLRFLWLTTLLASPKLPAVTLIDEPEVSLHPKLLRLFVELLREASQRTQLIVATHSSQLVRFLNPKEVITFDLEEDGLVKAQWADEFDLEAWLKDYTLDELWGMNLIGGRS
jgi:predicted ATPase